jgi:hypothetical protein
MPPTTRGPSGAAGGVGRRSDPRAAAVLLLLTSAVALSLLFGVAYGDLIAADASPRRSVASGARRGSLGVRLSGHVGGLYPGRVGTLWVRVHNPTRRPQVVGAVGAVVHDARARCAARNVRIGVYRRRLSIPPHGRRRVPLSIAMRPGAANACQQAVFPLTFRAEVRR